MLSYPFNVETTCSLLFHHATTNCMCVSIIKLNLMDQCLRPTRPEKESLEEELDKMCLKFGGNGGGK